MFVREIEGGREVRRAEARAFGRMIERERLSEREKESKGGGGEEREREREGGGGHNPNWF